MKPAGRDIEPALIEEWALAYLGRYASSAENLRRVLLRRARRRLAPGTKMEGAVAEAIDALVARYCATRLLDDAAYAAHQARRGLTRGRSLRQIAAGLAAKGVGAEDATAAVGELRAGSGRSRARRRRRLRAAAKLRPVPSRTGRCR